MPKLHGEAHLVILFANLATEPDIEHCTDSHKVLAEKISPHLTHPRLKVNLDLWLKTLESMAKR